MAQKEFTGQEILEMVRTRQITPEQGVKLFTGQEAGQGLHPRPVRRWHQPRHRQDHRHQAAGQENHQGHRIAVIGMAGRFPDANDINEFWDNLASAKDSVREITRWNLDQFYDPDPRTPGKSPSKWGGFLAGIERFDPLFFNISPKEAELMDPQQRLFLEESWKALEDAGYSGRSLEGKKCGVFIGFSASDYEDILQDSGVAPDAYVFTGNSESILSARISYFLNLKGPAITVNTACSSSLTAIHLACESIRARTCDMAIAGGVQVMNTPDLYIKTGRAGMLSPAGKCKAFDNRADGFVPGEGVGIVVLKPLDTAVQERDHIYGVIIGSGMNQDGRSNGITAPSATSQTALECEVYSRDHIHPETITYVETHGTGTKLGDPIEVHALTDAFRIYTDKKQYCALGSVKTNIGHTLAAAGAAGFIKALLCLKHQTLVPSLHFKQPNEHIQFDSSPFYVNTKLKNWNPPPGIPRRAAVSSFGFSGTNVHMVIEEYLPAPPLLDVQQPGMHLAVLSAGTRETLKNHARKLIDFLGKTRKISLADAAYTMQRGREAMEHRLAFTASTLAEVKEKLSAYLEGQTTPGNFHQGCISHDKTTAELLSAGRESEEFIRIIIQERNLDKLARLWVSGVDIPWELLYADTPAKPKRLSLPTYPFAGDRYWAPVVNPKPAAGTIGTAVMHPLLDSLDPALSMGHEGVVFRKVFRATEPVVRDHRVSHRMTLPGVAYLEMAAAAGFLATGCPAVLPHDPTIKTSPLRLSRVVWRQPLVVKQDKQEVRLVITPQDQHFAFAVQEFPHESNSPIIYAVGEIHFPDRGTGEEDTILTGDCIETVSLDEIKQRSTLHLDKEELYNRVLEMGISYGPYFQGVHQVWANTREALSCFCVPPACEGELARGTYTLHPSVMDSALQTIVGIFVASNPVQVPAVIPFSVSDVVYYRPFPARGYAYAVVTGENRFQVTILEENGTPCLKFQDAAFRQLKDRGSFAPRDYFFYFPTWKPGPAQTQEANTLIAETHKKVMVVYSPLPGIMDIKNLLVKTCKGLSHEVWEIPIDTPAGDTPYPGLEEIVRHLDAGEVPVIYFLGGLQVNDPGGDDGDYLEALDQSQERGVIALFRLLKRLIQLGMEQRVIYLKVITNDTHQVRSSARINPYGASLHGLVKSMAKEYPQWKAACIDISLEGMEPGGINLPHLEELVKQVIEEPGQPGGEEVVLRQGKRWVRTIEPLHLAEAIPMPFKSHGVYFILGGTGGIGLELSLYLAKTVQARLVLIGRRALQPHQEEKISRIKASGGRVLYIQADAANLESMTEAVQKAKDHFGPIHGVIHSAIVLEDMTIKNMKEETFRAALDPKVRGSAVLYRVFRKEKLAFMLFFSSAQSFTCLPGQSNYAAGCTFKDAFALHLRQQLSYPVKVINWGYWGSVGIVASETYNKSLANRGIYSIEPAEGMEAVRRILASPVTQVSPLKANQDFLERIGVNLHCPREVYPGCIPTVLGTVVSQLTLPAPDTQRVHRFANAFQEMTGAIPDLVLQVFRRMGVFLQAGQRYDKDQLQQQLNIIPPYSRLYTGLLEILERAGIIRVKGKEITSGQFPVDSAPINPGNISAPAATKEKAAQHPIIAAHANLLRACLDDLPLVLSGKKRYTEVMFPGGNRSLVEGIYTGTPISDYFHGAVAHIIKAYIRQRRQIDPGARIHILEIGAGTGGTSRFVLEALKDEAEHLCYWYTDISSGFTRYGQTAFSSDYPFVVFQVLDIEKPIETQGFTPGSMDLVFGSNVLHATRQMSQTLDHARRLLKTNGILLVNEATHNHDFATLTFGLTDGWWRYQDEEIRQPGSPLLGPHQWKELMETNGIRQVHIFDLPGTTRVEEFGQCVILGESDGNVRVPPGESAAGLEMEPGLEPGPKPALKIGTPPEPIPGFEPVPGKDLQGNLLDYVKKVFCEVLKIQEQRLNSNSTYERYGIDSLVSIDIIQRFEKDFGKLPATLLFENMSLGKLADYFLSRHGQRAAELFNRREPPEGQPAPLNPGAPTPKTGKKVMEPPLDPFPVKENGGITERVLQLSDGEVDELLQLLSNR
jgi:acyl transferase domain-containing protein/SAM-dependent methyltransferase/acyl carrier protein